MSAFACAASIDAAVGAPVRVIVPVSFPFRYLREDQSTCYRQNPTPSGNRAKNFVEPSSNLFKPCAPYRSNLAEMDRIFKLGKSTLKAMKNEVAKSVTHHIARIENIAAVEHNPIVRQSDAVPFVPRGSSRNPGAGSRNC